MMMQKRALDFLRTRPPVPVVAWILLAAGLALAGMAGYRYSQASMALDGEKARAAEVLPKTGRPAASRQPVAAAAATEDLLAVPWSDFFSRLERTRPADIAFLAMGVDGRKRTVTLAAEARSAEEMIAYLETLRQEAAFRSVVLSGHSMIQTEDGTRAVRFFARMSWEQ